MKPRSVMYRLHLAAGLGAGLFLAAIGLTGSLLVFRHEIDRCLNPHLLRVEPRGSRLPLETVLRSVREAFPGEVPLRVGLPQRDDTSCEVWLKAGGRRVYVDPYDGRVLGSRLPGRKLLGFTRAVHVELLGGGTGKTVVGVFGLLLLGLTVSGPALWWPGWGKIFRGLRINRGGSWRALLYSMHRVIGIGTAAFLFISALTGSCLVFGGASLAVLIQVTGLPEPRPAPQQGSTAGNQPLMLDALLAAADTAVPAARTTWVWLPEEGGLVVIRKKHPHEAQPNGKTYVYLDYYSGEVLQVVDSSQAADVTRITNEIYPLHTGEIGGGSTRLLALLSGTIPALLCATGIGSWSIRRRSGRVDQGLRHASAGRQ
jgi:uncharacterized iron-regulated membrane protein